MNESAIQNLFHQISAVNKKYEKIAAITGENFNIFRILKLDTKEVSLHTPFISELLNPKGSHGRGVVFLKLFVDRFCDKKIDFVFDSSNATVSGKYLGICDNDYLIGGNIDILIDDNHHKIIIENKINHTDQPNQLYRYHQHDRAAHLFYLTPDGRLPSSTSTGEEYNKGIKDNGKKLPIVPIVEGRDYYLLSYRSDILSWLSDCKKESVEYPLLRETITQYINLIKHLTYQTTNHNMEKEIMDVILSSKENVERAMEIAKSGDSIEQNILKKFEASLSDSERETGFKLSYSSPLLGHYETRLVFSKSIANNFSIAVEFTNYGHLDIGVCVSEGCNPSPEIKRQILEKMATSEFGKSEEDNNANWPWFVRYKGWDESSWWSVSNGEFKKVLYRDISEISKILGDLLT